MAFAHLHVHTVYSAFDGLARINELYSRAREIGIQGIAITDHGYMRGVPQFMRQFENDDIKPVAGCEIYLTDHYDHHIKDAEHRRYFHLILLAKNLVGYRNLCRICSEAAVNGSYLGKPRISHEFLEQHHEGLIAMSACIGGEIPTKIIEEEVTHREEIRKKLDFYNPQHVLFWQAYIRNDPGALRRANELYIPDQSPTETALEWYNSVFGDDFYLEVSQHASKKPGYSSDLLEKQKLANERIFSLGERYGIKVVATNDVHMVMKEDATAQEVLLCANSGKTMDEEDRLVYTGEEYLKSEQEMLEAFPDHPEAISNTMEVLNKIERYSIESPEMLPAISLPEGFKDENEYLKNLVREGLEWRRSRTSNPEFGKRGEDERLDYELGVINAQGCARYFLMIQDMVHKVRSLGNYAGIGRSTSPASMVCYVLGITDIDPMSEPFQMFERFINPDRKFFPGIDLDFDMEGWKAAYNYLQRKFGVDHVSRMAIFQRRSKGIAVRDTLKAYGLDEASAGDLLEYIAYPEYTFTKLRYMLEQEGPVLSWYNSASPEKRRIFDMAASIEDTMLPQGIHSCAVLLSDRPMTDFIPMQQIQDKVTGEMEYVSQYDKVFDLGPVRLNLYVLHPLDIIREASEGIEFPDTFDDPEVFRLFSEGNTEGIFMFEPEGMRNWLKKTGPTKFSELVDLYTMYRPGVMEHFDEYLENRERRRQGLGYLDPYDTVCSNLTLTENTYGLPIYQEQILLAARYFGDSKTGANRLRKALFCRGMDLKDRRADFFARVREKGCSSDYAEKLWSILEDFGKHAFPLSHAAAYVATAYRMAWLKVHHLEAFTNACRKFTVRDD